MNYQHRLNTLRGKMAEHGIHALALVPGTNMVYFTGLHFHLSERPVVAFVTPDALAFVVPHLEQSKLTERLDLNIAHPFAWTDNEGYTGAFSQAVETLQLGGAVIGVDELTLRALELLTLQELAPASTIQRASSLLLGIRMIKGAEEIDRLRRAIALSESALSQTLDEIKAGMTEQEIAERLTHYLSQNGSHGHSFQPIVLVGAKSALPHGIVGETVLGADDVLLIDFGGTYEGYPADITRTILYGTVAEPLQRAYQAVKSANEAARAAAKPGIPAHEVDRAARQVIEAAGFGEYFIHRTGHGLGLDVHEEPQISAVSQRILEAGMVFTIEPGIYLEGIGGVRIEDNMLITADGAESLTQFKRELFH